MADDIVRVIRIIEYLGPRSIVEGQVRRSLHGVREFGNGATITAVTLGEYPELMARGEEEEARRG